MSITAQNVRSASSTELKRWGEQCGNAARRSDVPQQSKQALQWADQCLSVAADRNHRVWAMWNDQKNTHAEQLAQLINYVQQVTSPRPATSPSSSTTTTTTTPTPTPTRTPPSRPSPADWVRMAREQTGYGSGSNQRARAWLEAVYGQMEERVRRNATTEERALLVLDLKNVIAALNSIPNR